MPQVCLVERVRLGPYVVDLHLEEIQLNGEKLPLQPLPFKVLALLLDNPGRVVSREDLRRKLWPADTFVDFEQGLNTAVRKLRRVLADDPDRPGLIETVPKRGYRLIAPVEVIRTNGDIPIDRDRGGAKLWQRKWLPSVALLVSVVAGGFLLFSAWGIYHRRPRNAGNRHWVVVLPFENLSRTADDDFLAAALTDGITTDLANQRSLRVIARTSADVYRIRNKPVSQIARELGVDTLLEGSVVRAGGRVRVTAQLIHAETESHLWAATYERNLDDVLAFESEIATTISHNVQAQLSPSERQSASALNSLDLETREAYLKGMFFWNQLSCDPLTNALSYFQQAVTRSPGFASGHAGLGEVYLKLAEMHCRSFAEDLEKARTESKLAFGLDENCAEAHAVYGAIVFKYEYQWDEGERELQRAVLLNPNYAVGHMWHAAVLQALGRDWKQEAKLAHQLDPVSLISNQMSGYYLYMSHDFDGAIAQWQNSAEMYPLSPLPYYWLGSAYEQKGEEANAVPHYIKAHQLWGKHPGQEESQLQQAALHGGLLGFWRELLKLRAAQMHDNKDPCWDADIIPHLRNKKQTIAMLAAGCGAMFGLKVDPVFDFVRAEPGFATILDKLHFPGTPPVT